MRALAVGSFSYQHVREILANSRDRIAMSSADPEWTSPAHHNLRKPDRFQ